MAKTYSNMLPLGTIAPNFKLLDVSENKIISLQDVKSDIATIIMFICNHCPFVKHIQHKMVDVAHHYQKQGMQFIAINSNDATQYTEDSPENMKRYAKDYGYSFPYLYDETQETAKAYQAACTPDFYVFDKNLACVYRGRFDASTPGNNQPVTGNELCQVLDDIIAGKEVSTAHQEPSVGCNIKWKKV